MPTTPDSDPAVPIPMSAIFSDIGNREKYTDAYMFWIKASVDTTPEEIAVKFNLNLTVLLEWMSTGAWVAAKDKYVKIYTQAAEMRDRARRAK